MQGGAAIVIVGGGPVGMSLALALAGAGVDVTLVEKNTFDNDRLKSQDGRATALSLSSKRLFDALGIADEISNHLSPINDIRVADGHPLREPSRFFTHFDHVALGNDPFGYIIDNASLVKALRERVLQEKYIQLRLMLTVDHVVEQEASISITLSNGEKIDAALLIAADGKKSPLREQAGIKILEVPYSQQALVCTVAHQRPHKGIAVELFMPSGPFAMLPMTGQRSNVVWVEPPERAKVFLELNDDLFLDELQQRFGKWLGEIRLEGERFSYPLSLMHARSYGRGRLILAGDAAHSIHPIAGQGLNLGFRDVAALAELIVNHKRLGCDVGDGVVLAQYERWRRFDNQAMTMATDLLNRLFSNDVTVLRWARDIGLGCVHHMPRLKRFLMREAMGLSGTLPCLLQGKPL